jgi:hypothetical protein
MGMQVGRDESPRCHRLKANDEPQGNANRVRAVLNRSDRASDWAIRLRNLISSWEI